MSEARDRRVRAVDIAEVYSRRRRSIIGNGSGEEGHGVVEIHVDQSEEESTPRTALRRRRIVEAGSGSGSGGRARNVRGRSFRGSLAVGRGGENVFPGSGRGRAQGGSVLPSWYPRRPLQDITSLVRAIEKRRARLGEGEGQSSQSSIPASTAHLVHDISMISPKPTSSRKPFPLTALEVPKVLLDTTNKSKEESEFLTPQKKLLNSIDTVEKVVMEELNKLKRTPTARKAEREKRVRTLMSMR